MINKKLFLLVSSIISTNICFAVDVRGNDVNVNSYRNNNINYEDDHNYYYDTPGWNMYDVGVMEGSGLINNPNQQSQPQYNDGPIYVVESQNQ